MAHDFFFGYGSLVDTRTHDHAPVTRARISGWRRAWCQLEGRAIATLTAVPDTASEIEGLVAPVADGDWAALDAREFCYDRHDATQQLVDLKSQGKVAIYAVPLDDMIRPQTLGPILLSYLDVVAHGYMTEFGAQGFERFVQSTDGWHTPVLNDREAPQYPRARPLAPEVRMAVDEALEALQVPMRALD